MADLESTIVHDLAGYMTSIAGLAEIVATRPEIDGRESLILSLAKESKAATQCVRDLQTIRSLTAGSVVEDVRGVEAAEWLELVKVDLPDDLAASLALPPDLPAIRADAQILAGLLARILMLADPHDGSLWSISASGGSVEIAIAMGTTERLDELVEGRLSGRKEMRALALADLLLPRWGARIEIEEGAAGALVVFVLQAKEQG